MATNSQQFNNMRKSIRRQGEEQARAYQHAGINVSFTEAVKAIYNDDTETLRKRDAQIAAAEIAEVTEVTEETDVLFIHKEADLHGANLRGAALHGADLHGADLQGAVGIPPRWQNS